MATVYYNNMPAPYSGLTPNLDQVNNNQINTNPYMETTGVNNTQIHMYGQTAGGNLSSAPQTTKSNKFMKIHPEKYEKTTNFVPINNSNVVINQNLPQHPSEPNVANSTLPHENVAVTNCINVNVSPPTTDPSVNSTSPVLNTNSTYSMEYIKWYLENKDSVEYYKNENNFQIPTEEEIRNYYVYIQQPQSQSPPPSGQYQPQQQQQYQPQPPPPPQQKQFSPPPPPVTNRKTIKIKRHRSSCGSDSDNDNDSESDDNKESKDKPKSKSKPKKSSESDSDSEDENTKEKSNTNKNDEKKSDKEINKKPKKIVSKHNRRKFSSSSSSSDDDDDDNDKHPNKMKSTVEKSKEQPKEVEQAVIKKEPKFVVGTPEYDQHMKELFGDDYEQQRNNSRKKKEEEADESLMKYYYDLIEKDELDDDCSKTEYLIGCKVNAQGLYDCPKCNKKDAEGSKMFSLKCSHIYCYDCYSDYVKEKIEGGATYKNLKCMDDECDEKFTYNILKYLKNGEALSIKVIQNDDME